MGHVRRLNATCMSSRLLMLPIPDESWRFLLLCCRLSECFPPIEACPGTLPNDLTVHFTCQHLVLLVPTYLPHLQGLTCLACLSHLYLPIHAPECMHSMLAPPHVTHWIHSCYQRYTYEATHFSSWLASIAHTLDTSYSCLGTLALSCIMHV